MKKHTACVLLGFACAAALTTGCGKKHEKIDLGSTHTTAETTATETMAPEDPSEPASDPSIDVTLDAAVENAASSNAGSGTSSGSGSAVTANGVKSSMTTYTEGDSISIQYPVFADLGSTQDAVNALIKKNALSVLEVYDTANVEQSLDITCKVSAADKPRITLVYKGTGMTKGAAYPTSLFYTNTVDVRKASDIDLPYLADPDTLADYVLSDKCVYVDADGKSFSASSEALAPVHADRDKNYYRNLFSQADFPYTGEFPACFSYEYQGEIYFSIPVPHAIGDYLIAVYTPENK